MTHGSTPRPLTVSMAPYLLMSRVSTSGSTSSPNFFRKEPTQEATWEGREAWNRGRGLEVCDPSGIESK